MIIQCRKFNRMVILAEGVTTYMGDRNPYKSYKV